jgi:hypothetical protein
MKYLLCGIVFIFLGQGLWADMQPQAVAPIEWADWSNYGFGVGK